MHLASETRLTNGVWSAIGVHLHASHPPLVMHGLDICMIVMSKTSVPKCEVQWDSGDKLGMVGDGSSGAREIGSVVCINGSRKADLVMLEEVHARLSDVNMISMLLGERQHSHVGVGDSHLLNCELMVCFASYLHSI